MELIIKIKHDKSENFTTILKKKKTGRKIRKKVISSVIY